MPNIGEKDEILVLRKLFQMKGRRIPCLGVIESVADYRGDQITNIRDIKKAPSHSKRDVIINGIGYSLKSTRAAPAAIVNHTTREKWIRVCKELGLHIKLLDIMVDEYWDLRLNGEIGEDIWTYQSKCPFGNTPQRKNYLKKVINYFLFKGTGAKDNEFPAEKILEITYPSNADTWILLEKDEAFKKLWPNMKFSVRASKGMPPDYPNMKDRVKKELIEPWVRYCNDKFRGSLHIRAGRSR